MDNAPSNRQEFEGWKMPSSKAPKSKRTRRRPAGEQGPLRVTIRDVARQTRLSLTTISRALRAQPGISEQTRERVKKAALKLGYVPNIAGAALSTGRTQSAIYILPASSPTITGLLQMEVLRGLIDTLSTYNYTVNVISAESLSKLGLSIFEVHRAFHADGVIVVLEQAETTKPIADKHSLPTVIVNHPISKVRADFVLADDEGGAFDATSHLIGLGHERIAHITISGSHVAARKRTAGYQRALRTASIPVTEGLIVKASAISADAGYSATKRLLESGAEFTGLFSASDVFVPGIIRALKEDGRAIPDDVAIVSFDNHPFAEMIDPPLTTIYKPRYEMGAEAARLLMRRLSGSPMEETVTTVLGTHLIPRGSSGQKIRPKASSTRS